MKAISIRQPWAWLIVHGAKVVENRSWATSYRGPLLIHAAKGCTLDEWSDAWEYIQEVHPGVLRVYNPPTHLACLRGGIVGVVDQTGCIDNADQVDSPDYCSWAEPGQWHHLYSNPRTLPFMPCRGSLGLWDCEVML